MTVTFMSHFNNKSMASHTNITFQVPPNKTINHGCHITPCHVIVITSRRSETDSPFLLMSSSTSFVKLATPGGMRFKSFSLMVRRRRVVSRKNFWREREKERERERERERDQGEGERLEEAERLGMRIGSNEKVVQFHRRLYSMPQKWGNR